MRTLSWNYLVIFLLLCTLTGCAHLSPTPKVETAAIKSPVNIAQLTHWQIKGKIAVQTAQDAGSASIDWIQNPNTFMISLYGPLGTHGLKLTGQPGLVTMQTSDGKKASASSPEQLLSQHWGWNLPVSNLKYWVRGLPVPGIPSHRMANSLSQQGWQIQYLSYSAVDNANLPNKIYITSPSLKVKLIISEWKI